MSWTSVRLINPLEVPQWNDWLKNSTDSTIFHSANWARVLSESYGYHPVYFVLPRPDRKMNLLPVMEVDSLFTGKRGVCLSFSDYCAALVENDQQFQQLFQQVIEYGRGRGWRYVEFRGEARLDGQTPREAYTHHLIKLTKDEAQMRSRLRNSTARNIQKAVKENVVVDMTSSWEGLLDFYRLHCLTRKRQGLPPQPLAFFEKVHGNVIAKGLGFTALARRGDATVAALVCLFFGTNAIYKYGASDPQYQHLRANNLLLWETIKRCGRDGFQSLSLGRTDLKNSGLNIFKDGWGGEKSYLSYYRYDLTAGRFCTGGKDPAQRYRGIFRNMPVSMLRMLGAITYKHLG